MPAALLLCAAVCFRPVVLACCVLGAGLERSCLGVQLTRNARTDVAAGPYYIVRVIIWAACWISGCIYLRGGTYVLFS